VIRGKGFGLWRKGASVERSSVLEMCLSRLNEKLLMNMDETL